MDDTITTIYCLCDDFLKAVRHRRDDPQARLSTAEVMTIPLVAATFFGGNVDKTRRFLYEYGYMKKMISKSRLNRRIHRIETTLWAVLFELLARVFIERNDPEFQTYAVDSLPVPVCDNIRIRRCRIYPLEIEEGHDGGDQEARPPERKNKSFRGYIASKRRYFYGLRVHLVVTGAGEPVEFALAAGSEVDVTVFKELNLDLPEGSIICADKAYTDYEYEDLLKEAGLHLKAQRKKRSKRPMAAWEEFVGKPIRQYIETVFSRLSGLFSRKIHAVTPRGFELKIVWFLLAFSIQCL
ncbi:MAG: IS982 family transposase [Rubrobacteraceae bacterium]|nr:IS982 family transposase [Rubrobacteraceae bacterium]